MNDSVVVVLLGLGISEDEQRRQSSSEGTLTRAPMTPSEVRRRYSKGRVFEVVLRKG